MRRPWRGSMTEQYRVLLIQPPFTVESDCFIGVMAPLGLAYLAAVLEREPGCVVTIIDALAEGFATRQEEHGRIRHGLAETEILQRIAAADPDLIGISMCFSNQAADGYALAAAIRRARPAVKLVVGGAHATALPEETLRCSGAEYAVLGEGEMTLRELVRYLRGERADLPAGLAWRDGAAVRIARRGAYVEHPGELPHPARHLLDMERYFAINRPHGPQTTTRVANMITSRGCPGACVFCAIHGIWGKRYRARPVADVLAEIRELVVRYGIEEIQFEDDNLTLDRARAAELFRGLIREFPGLRWGAPNGVAVWALDDELLTLMAQSGCHFVTLAVESGSQRVLNEVICKPLKLAGVQRCAQRLRALGVRVDAMFVIGLPGETKAEIEETIRYALALGLDDVSFFIATPYPGTELYERCRANGWLTPDYDLAQLQVHKRGFIQTPDFTPSEIVALRQQAIDRFLESRLKRGWRNRLKFAVKCLLRAAGWCGNPR